MPILRDTVLLPSGAYDLEARAPAPKWLLNLRQGPYSLHHILPYRYPQFIGFLAETYRRNFVPAGAAWPAANDERSQMIAQLRAMIWPPGAQERPLSAQFAWMGVNLFEGPAGELRIDDPGSNVEPNKPVSMSKDLWRQLNALRATIDRLAALSSVGGNNASVLRNISVGEFDDLLYRLSPLMLRRSGGALPFDETDWICVSATEPRFQLAPSAIVTQPIRDVFRVFATGNPRKLRLYRPDTRQFGPTVPILWRLRLAPEAVPADVFNAPKLQP